MEKNAPKRTEDKLRRQHNPNVEYRCKSLIESDPQRTPVVRRSYSEDRRNKNPNPEIPRHHSFNDKRNVKATGMYNGQDYINNYQSSPKDFYNLKSVEEHSNISGGRRKFYDNGYTAEDNYQTLPRRRKLANEELISKSNAEPSRTDLLSDIASLKIKLASSEKSRNDLEERLLQQQKQINELQSRILDKHDFLDIKPNQSPRNGSLTNDSNHELNRSLSLERSPSDKDKTLDRLRRKHSEVERLKKVVESLMTTNSEKDQNIDDLRQLLTKYRKLEDNVVTTYGKKGLEELGFDEDQVDGDEINNQYNTKNDHRVMFERLEIVEPGDNMPNPDATSTPVARISTEAKPPLPVSLRVESTVATSLNFNPPSSPAPVRSSSSENLSQTLPVRSSSSENMSQTMPSPKVAMNGLPSDKGYGTLPATLSNTSGQVDVNMNEENNIKFPPDSSISDFSTKGHPPRHPGGLFATFGKSFSKLRSGFWSTSAPSLGETETEENVKEELVRQYKAMQENSEQNAVEARKKKGIKRFFDKLRKGSSSDINGEVHDPFKRNILRSTAGPRLGWSKDFKIDLDVPFSRWDSDRVASWLHSIGLSMYVGECKRWVKNGKQLLGASLSELEKELGIRNQFHKKKLHLTLQAICQDGIDKMEELDYQWVNRWLDDVGLPQYKDSFMDARIDGRMLQHLTIDDLVTLRITNALHHLSIKRGIQLLKFHDFSPNLLKRRPAPNETSVKNCPQDVMLWTNHRVMEWLRTIDLSEYAPNLRGSGVHGALMVLEPRFGDELFASILSIPNSKTLLRRHLSTHFVTLVGHEVQHKKRDLEATPGFVPLTPNQKIKLKKFALFAHKRTRSLSETDDVIPPIDTTKLKNESNKRSSLTNQKNGSVLNQDKKEECIAAKEIGCISNELDTLTHLLAKDEFFDDSPTSNV